MSFIKNKKVLFVIMLIVLSIIVIIAAVIVFINFNFVILYYDKYTLSQKPFIEKYANMELPDSAVVEEMRLESDPGYFITDHLTAKVIVDEDEIGSVRIWGHRLIEFYQDKEYLMPGLLHRFDISEDEVDYQVCYPKVSYPNKLKGSAAWTSDYHMILKPVDGKIAICMSVGVVGWIQADT